MAQIIQIKRGTGSAVPSSLAEGELALNVDSGKLYYGQTSTSASSDFRVDSITAQQYIVSSSVTSITTQTLSGSTAFGDSADDTHTFIGNITASGNISASGDLIASNIQDVATTNSPTFAGLTVNPTGEGQVNIISSQAVDLKIATTHASANRDVGIELSGSGAQYSLALNRAHGTFVIAPSTVGDAPNNAVFALDVAGNVTASGNISSSGDIIGKDGIFSGDSCVMEIIGINSIGGIVGTDTDHDLVFRRNNTEGFRLGPGNHITASGNISASGLNHTFGGNVTIIKSGSDGDAVLTLFADSENDNEAANPYIHLKQDIGGVSGQIGLTGADHEWPDGTTLTGAAGNSMIIGMTGSAGSNNRQLYLVAGNTASLEIRNDADVHIMNGDLYLDNQNALYGDGHLLIKFDSEVIIGAGNRPLELNSTTMEVNGLATFKSAMTASGDISASGTLSGQNIYMDSALIHNGDTDTGIQFSADDRIDLVTGNSVRTRITNGGVNITGHITASGNVSASGTITGQAGLIQHSITGTTDGEAKGDVVYFGGTTSMTAGAIYHYKSDGTWELADADDNTKSDGLLGVALGAASDTNGVLLRGMVTLDHDPGAVGDPIYLTTTAGDANATAPSGNGNIVRIIGYCLDASNGQIWFNPDSTFVEVNA